MYSKNMSQQGSTACTAGICPNKGLLHVQREYVLTRVYCMYSENMSQQGSTACTVRKCPNKGLLHVQ